MKQHILSIPTTHPRLWQLLGVLALLLATAGPARAASFNVNARIFCPASLVPAPILVAPASPFLGPTLLLDSTFATAVQRPCAGIRVVAMDADPLFDEYCGAGYTDSGGRVSFRGDCGDTIRPLPEVYLRVEAKSFLGFSVGVIETNLFERIADQLEDAWDRLVEDGVPVAVPVLDLLLRPHQTFAWLSPVQQQVRDGGSLNVEGAIGDGGPVSAMVARQFWAAQQAMFRLDAGTRYEPMHFNYTVNAPLPPFTIAFTAYDTVIVDSTNTPMAMVPAALVATAHEIGHVLYNTYHSDNLHWLRDVFNYGYMRSHTLCGSETLAFAWYEGFAHFVRDYVRQQWVWPEFRWAGLPLPPGVMMPGLITPSLAGLSMPPDPGCARTRGVPGLAVEGNVAGLLNNVFFGPVTPALNTAANPTSGGLAFLCPDGGPVLTSNVGAPECELQVPATCTVGNLLIDGNGLTDQCSVWVEDRRCAAERRRLGNPPNFVCPYDPVEQIRDLACASGPAIWRSGRDACTARVPASHTLPSGNPRPRPDGTPDMQIGMASGVPAWFSLPALDDIMSWVDTAGIDGHRPREYWESWIKPWCVGRDGLRDRYCNPSRSPSFFGELTTFDPALM